jgi:large subunit ribosomal protein L7Ae
MAEIPKEVVEKAYEAIEIARSTGKIKKGTNEATKAIERGVAKMVVYAANTSPKEVIMHIPMLCKEKGILCLEVPSREELGASTGIPVATAAVAIVSEGESKSVIKFIKDSLESKEEPKKEEKQSEAKEEREEKKEEDSAPNEEPKSE